MGLFARPLMSCGKTGCGHADAILADEELLDDIKLLDTGRCPFLDILR